MSKIKYVEIQNKSGGSHTKWDINDGSQRCAL